MPAPDEKNTPASDEELMSRVRDGDADAFDELVRRHERGVLHFFFQHCWDHHRSEDLAQETFTRVFRARADYFPRARFTTYLYRVARNLWVDTLRRAAHRPREISLDGAGAPEDALSLADSLPGPTASPEEEARLRELQAALRAGIADLPEEQRVVFHLGETRGLPYAEISQMLDIPVGTVKSRMHAAMLRLREVLRRVGAG